MHVFIQFAVTNEELQPLPLHKNCFTKSLHTWINSEGLTVSDVSKCIYRMACHSSEYDVLVVHQMFELVIASQYHFRSKLDSLDCPLMVVWLLGWFSTKFIIILTV